MGRCLIKTMGKPKWSAGVLSNDFTHRHIYDYSLLHKLLNISRMLRYAANVRQSLVSHFCPILSPFCDFKGVVVTPITPHPFSRSATESRKYGGLIS